MFSLNYWLIAHRFSLSFCNTFFQELSSNSLVRVVSTCPSLLLALLHSRVSVHFHSLLPSAPQGTLNNWTDLLISSVGASLFIGDTNFSSMLVPRWDYSCTHCSWDKFHTKWDLWWALGRLRQEIMSSNPVWAIRVRLGLRRGQSSIWKFEC